jgi:hypothetical protein
MRPHDDIGADFCRERAEQWCEFPGRRFILPGKENAPYRAADGLARDRVKLRQPHHDHLAPEAIGAFLQKVQSERTKQVETIRLLLEQPPVVFHAVLQSDHQRAVR